ncbi:MAG: branched-chain amino acid aminotransferase [Cyanophyceae cyanobacterium]
MTYWYDGQWIDGETITLSIRDPALIYGANTFTTLRVIDGQLHHPATHWGLHRDRLLNSLKSLGWPEPDWPRLEMAAAQLAREYAVLRVVILADGREWIVGRSLPADRQTRRDKGVIAWLAVGPTYQRAIAAQKTGNYLPSWLALNDAQRHGAAEGILLDHQGHWLETSTGNLWGYRDRGPDGPQWLTPELGAILPGIAREVLVAALRSRGETVEESPWTPDLVESLDAIAYSNSVYGPVPIHTVLDPDGHPLRDRPAPADRLKFLQTLWP